ncbi:hypothetical protein EON67_04155 [archaeon]|nr:MAG: hypothetical protein EON67_04155 [archaeon]
MPSCARARRDATLCRSTESNKAGKDAKFAVLAAAARHPQLTLLGEYFQKELSTAFKQGPYYVPPVDPSVAVASRV